METIIPIPVFIISNISSSSINYRPTGERRPVQSLPISLRFLFGPSTIGLFTLNSIQNIFPIAQVSPFIIYYYSLASIKQPASSFWISIYSLSLPLVHLSSLLSIILFVPHERQS